MTAINPRRVLAFLLAIALALVVLPAVGASADGVRSRECAILVWFDSVEIVADTDADELDEWQMEGVLRTRRMQMPTYDNDFASDVTIIFPPLRRLADPSAIGKAAFVGDAGDTVVLEQEWSTEIWRKMKKRWRDYVPLNDLSLVVREKDGRQGDDKGTAAFDFPPRTKLPCGETISFEVPVTVDPLGLRGSPEPEGQVGELIVGITITTVDVLWPPPGCGSTIARTSGFCSGF
jgi:hypothetical protein